VLMGPQTIDIDLVARDARTRGSPGSIDAVPDLTIGGWSCTPNWWWPDDRAWVVVSELDTPSTYVGGSAALAQAILDEPQLEVVPSHPDHRFDWLGDRINASG
jgi:hypothetical protein